MVIEQFHPHELSRIHERFSTHGRMLPPGVEYRASWIDPAGLRCFQLMEAADPERLRDWVGRWDDLVDFDIVPVVTSDEFWREAR